MSFPIVTLFYGAPAQREAYAPLLRRWLDHHRSMGLGDRLVVAHPLAEPAPAADLVGDAQLLALGISGYRKVIRQGHPFDVKGALMCELLAVRPGAFLFLDLDAFVQRTDLQLPSADVLIGMARDIGAIDAGHSPFLEVPFATVRKRCAGVVWFGARDAAAAASIASEYARAWRDLRKALPGGRVPWEPQLPHLLEQYAWSLVAARLGQPVLSDRWNWPPHVRGESRLAYIHHEFGWSKWKALGRTAPRNV